MHTTTSIARIEVPYGSALRLARGSPSQIGATYAAATLLAKSRLMPDRCDNHLTVGRVRQPSA